MTDLLLALHAIDRRAAAEFARLFDRLTLRQYMALAAIDGTVQGANQTYLVARTGIDRSTLSAIVARLVEAGFVVTRDNPRDRRANLVVVTRRGRAILKRARPHAAAAEALVAGSFADLARTLSDR